MVVSSVLCRFCCLMVLCVCCVVCLVVLCFSVRFSWLYSSCVWVCSVGLVGGLLVGSVISVVLLLLVCLCSGRYYLGSFLWWLVLGLKVSECCVLSYRLVC